VVVLIIPAIVFLLLLHVVGGALALALLGAAVAFEAAEKGFLVLSTRRLPLAVGPETMVGQRVTVVSACRPIGRVRLGWESWPARCAEGADAGETLQIEAVRHPILVVGYAEPASARPTPGGERPAHPAKTGSNPAAGSSRKIG
jgi:membrane protein implicated in regulation of membrane protease activity